MPLVEILQVLFNLSGEVLCRLFSFERFHAESYELFSLKDGDAEVSRTGRDGEDSWGWS